MDPRRLLILPAASLTISACAILPRPGFLNGPSLLTLSPASTSSPAAAAKATSLTTDFASLRVEAPILAVVPGSSARSPGEMAPIPNPLPKSGRRRAPRATVSGAVSVRDETARSGLAAIGAANAAARETSRARGFLGSVQVFAYDPGRVYEVWTAPLRVTTLTFSAGETVVSKAAGDTVRWQIGETQSGEGANQRAHVMIKPLQRGLETNLVLATSRRVYFVELRSGPPETFNAAVTWDLGSLLEASPLPREPARTPSLVAAQGPLDAGFRIAPKGRRPAWTPMAVMTDGVRTFLAFPPDMTTGEAPALFALSGDGEAQLINYRQQGGLWVVDQVLQAAELRSGGRRPQVVRIVRQGGAS